MQHIFLTGEKQVGKSTIWQKALAEKNYTGFVTRPFFVEGEKKGYYFHSLTPLLPWMNDCPCVIRVNERRHAAVLDVFDGAAVQALDQARQSPVPLILMDEIGKAERKAAVFVQAVQQCLNAPCHHVLGVLQRGDAPLQEAIRQRDDVLLLEVTPENRDEILEQVVTLLEEWEE